MRYAIDVPMPIGTDILAIRAGVVIGVIENYVDGDNTPGHENWVFVRHEDNTVAAYAHLTNMGAVVEVGESVAQGALIGWSGHTGNSTEPHLHFDVRPACLGGLPCTSLPSETVPLNFRNAQPSRGDLSCGLRAGVSYTALAE
ncbi:M23 family metallopeptidase [Steroidobacter agaridevorans]|nr:M23 family metallopeptidase [Steroidobacter agaridevorans]